MPDEMDEFESQLSDIQDPLGGVKHEIDLAHAHHILGVAEHLIAHLSDLSLATDSVTGQLIARRSGTSLLWTFDAAQCTITFQMPMEEIMRRVEEIEAAVRAESDEVLDEIACEDHPEWPPQELGGEG